ncbi:ATP-binding cassette domain-containing protein [Arcanobacterium bovis]|uniref:ATP-binding cassette domain-containing protein n=1 Tax=Arcanobacterium bovis TaxID=2529275 RepID=A0A4Q9V2I9_9ACTO|nr:ATP-binding cassette domain-containing protein [Arcanobacterium bovis]TBW23875.1 ATP-binding cassette domain-containing protein [Arcanobacterium bovis]
MRFLPRWLLAPAMIAVVFLSLPLVAIAVRIPWSSFFTVLQSGAAQDAIELSLLTCAASTLLSVGLGFPLALVFGRAGEQGKLPWWLAVLRALVTVPLVMPPVVAGIALLTTFGRNGILGGSLSAFGISIPYTTCAVVLAQTFVSMPFLIVTVEAAVKTQGTAYERRAHHLGASRWRQFSRITVPLLMPSLLAGAALAAARSLGEFGATITFAGSMQGITRTLPLEVYLQREVNVDTALALSMVLISIALLLTLVTNALESYGSRRFRRSASVAAQILDDDAAAAVPAERSVLPQLQPSWPVLPPEQQMRSERQEQHEHYVRPAQPAQPWKIRVDVPDWNIDMEIASSTHKVLALIGPNGAGKSTTARFLAGDLPSNKLGSRCRSQIQAKIGFLQQNPALFPHMSVLHNVAFGPRCQGKTPQQALDIARQELVAVGMADFADFAPHELSGGQAQRIALAQALAVRPDLLVLDEPFAGIDFQAQSILRNIIHQRTRQGLGAVLITHELLDVVSLADDIAVLEQGRLVACAPIDSIINNPPNEFVASFLGVNLLVGEYFDEAVRVTSTLAVHSTDVDDIVSQGAIAAAIFDPAAVALHAHKTGGSPRNSWNGIVTRIQMQHATALVSVLIDGAHAIKALVTASAMVQLDLHEGKEVTAEVKATQVRITARD